MPRASWQGSVARALVLVLLFSGWVIVSPPLRADRCHHDRPISSRFETNDNGAITIIGNNVLTCPSSFNCPNIQGGGGSGPETSNNDHNMVNLDQDGFGGGTFNSSNATLSLPSDSTVLFAGLYWGARQTNSFGGFTPNSINQMVLRLPGESTYRTIFQDDGFGPADSTGAYQRFADVTDLVQLRGSGVYWGGNVAAGTGFDRYGGWSLVIAYQDPTAPLRNLTVFDGFSEVGSNSDETITVGPFVAPQLGPVDTRLGMVAYEGDLGNVGDEAFLAQTRLATAQSGGTNFFNGTNDLDGTIVTARQPAHVNMLGFDIKQLGVPNANRNDAQFATIRLDSSSDRYYIGVVTTSINLYAPNFTLSRKAVTNLSGHDPAQVGDTLEYTVTSINSGLDPATDIVLTDPLPPNTTFVPGSLAVVTGPNGGPKTDANADDQAEYLALTETVRFRLGSGATGTTGGTLFPGMFTSVRFRVTVDAEAGGTTLANEVTIAYVAATIDAPFSHVTNRTETPVAADADLSVTKVSAPNPVAAGADLTSTIVVTNNGPRPRSASS